jgi:hypothetical protein
VPTSYKQTRNCTGLVWRRSGILLLITSDKARIFDANSSAMQATPHRMHGLNGMNDQRKEDVVSPL